MPVRTDSHTELLAVQQSFEEHFPGIERLARLQHRRLHGHTQDDAVADTIGWTWKAFRKMALAGKDPVPFIPSLVRYAAGHVRAGKLLGRSESSDILSRSCRQEGGYHVTGLPTAEKEVVASEVRDALRSRQAGPAAEAILNADHEAWLESLTPRERHLAESLRDGTDMTEIASLRGISKQAVQDMRKTMARKWGQRGGYSDPLGR